MRQEENVRLLLSLTTRTIAVVVWLLIFMSSVGWAQGLQTTKPCTVPGQGQTVQAYLCLDDIVVVDGSSSGIYLVDPVTGNQTPISTAVNAPIINGHPVDLLQQVASLTIEPGTGKLDRKSTRLNSSHTVISY